MTTLGATFLGWRLSAAPSPAVTSDCFGEPRTNVRWRAVAMKRPMVDLGRELPEG